MVNCGDEVRWRRSGIDLVGAKTNGITTAHLAHIVVSANTTLSIIRAFVWSVERRIMIPPMTDFSKIINSAV